MIKRQDNDAAESPPVFEQRHGKADDPFIFPAAVGAFRVRRTAELLLFADMKTGQMGNMNPAFFQLCRLAEIRFAFEAGIGRLGNIPQFGRLQDPAVVDDKALHAAFVNQFDGSICRDCFPDLCRLGGGPGSLPDLFVLAVVKGAAASPGCAAARPPGGDRFRTPPENRQCRRQSVWRGFPGFPKPAGRLLPTALSASLLLVFCRFMKSVTEETASGSSAMRKSASRNFLKRVSFIAVNLRGRLRGCQTFRKWITPVVLLFHEKLLSGGSK